MPAKRLINLNGSGGPLVSVTSSIISRYVEFVESADVTGQGITYQTNEAGNNFATTYTAFANATQTLGNLVAKTGGFGAIQGMPAQTDSFGNTIAATTLFKARSNTASTTKLLVTEHD